MLQMIPDVTSVYFETRGGSLIAEKAKAIVAVRNAAVGDSNVSATVYVNTGSDALMLRIALANDTVVDSGGDERITRQTINIQCPVEEILKSAA